MRCEYVCDYYNVPADIGRGVIVDGKSGVIVEDRGTYIGVNFDDDNPGEILNCHPTWRVQYGDIRKIRTRKMTRSQMRYQEYLKIADCYDSFAAYLGIKGA